MKFKYPGAFRKHIKQSSLRSNHKHNYYRWLQVHCLKHEHSHTVTQSPNLTYQIPNIVKTSEILHYSQISWTECECFPVRPISPHYLKVSLCSISVFSLVAVWCIFKKLSTSPLLPKKSIKTSVTTSAAPPLCAT